MYASWPDLLSGDDDLLFTEDPPPLGDNSDASIDMSDPESLETFSSSMRWPVYVRECGDGTFKCMWCRKQFLVEGMLEMHLRGKDHTKRCVNSGVSLYGTATHLEEARRYVEDYGNDPYARLKHWPTCIADNGQYWSCHACNSKKFQTQRAVNDHLLEPSHLERVGRQPGMAVVQESAPTSSARLAIPAVSGSMAVEAVGWDSYVRSPDWPDCVVEEGQFWKCLVCNKKFNSNEMVDLHLQHPRHLSRVAYSGLGPVDVDSSCSPSYSRSARCRRGLTPTRAAIASDDLLEKLSVSLDYVSMECYLCERRFSSLKETEDHKQDLVHIANWYEDSVRSAEHPDPLDQSDLSDEPLHMYD